MSQRIVFYDYVKQMTLFHHLTKKSGAQIICCLEEGYAANSQHCTAG